MTQDSQATAAAKPVKPVKRPKHLMDPNNLQRPVNNRKLTNVQRWLMAVTIVITSWHLAIGLHAASWVLTDSAVGAKVGLNVIGSVFTLLGLVAGFALHQKNVFTWPHWPWLAVCLIPGVFGTWLALSV